VNLKNFAIQIENESDLKSTDLALTTPDFSNFHERLESFLSIDSSFLFDVIYRHFDGQKGDFNMLGEFRLNSLQESLGFYEDYRSEFAHQESNSCRDERIMDGFLWRSGWFPFAWDETDNRVLVMDFSPSTVGTLGQIFLYDCRQTLGDWIAPDLSSFLDTYYLKLVESEFAKDEWVDGRFAVRVDGRNIYDE
jgi:cell wall assembly regulator SMI1